MRTIIVFTSVIFLTLVGRCADQVIPDFHVLQSLSGKYRELKDGSLKKPSSLRHRGTGGYAVDPEGKVYSCVLGRGGSRKKVGYITLNITELGVKRSKTRMGKSKQIKVNLKKIPRKERMFMYTVGFAASEHEKNVFYWITSQYLIKFSLKTKKVLSMMKLEVPGGPNLERLPGDNGNDRLMWVTENTLVIASVINDKVTIESRFDLGFKMKGFCSALVVGSDKNVYVMGITGDFYQIPVTDGLFGNGIVIENVKEASIVGLAPNTDKKDVEDRWIGWTTPTTGGKADPGNIPAGGLGNGDFIVVDPTQMQ
jgi:hypothetical protein